MNFIKKNLFLKFNIDSYKTTKYMSYVDCNNIWLQECCKQYWTSHGGSTPQSSSSMATYYPSQKLSKLDESDMRDTAGEVRMNS